MCETNNKFTIVQPELLSNEELANHIKKRCPSLKDVPLVNRKQLLYTYRQMALSLSQRHYPENSWRGRLLTSSQNRSSNPSFSVPTKSDTATARKRKHTNGGEVQDLNKIIINDRSNHSKIEEISKSFSNLKATTQLKRSIDDNPGNLKCDAKTTNWVPSKPKKQKITWP